MPPAKERKAPSATAPGSCGSSSTTATLSTPSTAWPRCGPFYPRRVICWQRSTVTAITACGRRVFGSREMPNRRHFSKPRLNAWGKAPEGQTSGIPGFSCYRTVEETFATAEAIVADHPEIAAWVDVGDSWEKLGDPDQGYDIRVLQLGRSISDGPDPDKPKLFVNTAIHAREYTTAELGTRFGLYLASNYGKDPRRHLAPRPSRGSPAAPG